MVITNWSELSTDKIHPHSSMSSQTLPTQNRFFFLWYGLHMFDGRILILWVRPPCPFFQSRIIVENMLQLHFCGTYPPSTGLKLQLHKKHVLIIEIMFSYCWTSYFWVVEAHSEKPALRLLFQLINQHGRRIASSLQLLDPVPRRRHCGNSTNKNMIYTSPANLTGRMGVYI